MAWLIGIDEAGYGPNLGPLVMSGIVCRVPESAVLPDLWTTLAAAVRRQADPDLGQLVIDDSKAVYGSGRGLAPLELSVLSTLLPWPCERFTLGQYLARFAPTALAQLATEPWFDPRREVVLPVEVPPPELVQHSARWQHAAQTAGIEWQPACSVLLCARRFNEIVEQAGNKGAALAWGLTEVLSGILPHLPGDEPVFVAVDKHGGRNTYSAMLQQALHEGMVLAQQEGSQRSVYQVIGLQRRIQFTFQPRADAEHFVVALASMVSKYLRELLMLEFNRYWLSLIPGLKPTAGYPLDAGRFLEAIRPQLEKNGVAIDHIWRRR